MFGKGLFKGLGITFQHAFEPDITIQYPEERPALAERFRGSLAYQFEKCIACGLCIKACPNRVLTLETFVPAGSKKKQTLSYTIDRQYCLYCNLCVEICPTSTLYFSHNFELTQRQRADIKVVYTRPPALNLRSPEPAPAASTAGSEEPPVSPAITGAETAEAAAGADSKRLKQVQALKTVLTKSPHRALLKVLESEADIDLLAKVIGGDDKRLVRLAELMVDDRDKAQKFAAALVSKARKEGTAGGGETS